MLISLIKWISLPVLLIGSLFSGFAASYEILLNLLVWMGALVIVERTVAFKEYFWAAGLVGIAVVFSPLTLPIKIFVLMSFTCIGTLMGVYASWKPQPLPAMEAL
jgi:hypothetical protein